MMGAAVLAVKAALSAGVGYAVAAVPEKEKDVIFTSVPEAVVLPVGDKEEIASFVLKNKIDLVLAGPGLGKEKASAYIPFLLNDLKLPFVLDGDGLNALTRADAQAFKTPCVFTPHPLEAARLLCLKEPPCEKERENAAKEISRRYNCVCVLKGKETVIVYNNEVFINTTGSDSLAKAGTGDVLAGIITGFWAQEGKQNGFSFGSALRAAVCGVYIHGLAGEDAALDISSYSVLASDLNKYIGRAIKKTLNN